MAVEFLESQYNLKPRKRTKFLYTKGFQYSLDGENYIGEYHLQGDKAYTGPEKTATSRLLRKYYSDALVYAYDRCRGFPKRDRIEPNQIVWLPLETNYKTGYAIRYFVERAGKYEGYPIEIDDEQKSKYGKDGGIDEGVYTLAEVKWKLTGPERSIYKDGNVYIEGVFDHNQRQVLLNTKIIPNLEYAIKSYTEFARFTLVG